LRKLGVKTIRMDVVDLTDEQMALRCLEENLQREGLTDLEKADAVAHAISVMEKAGVKGPTRRVAERLNLDHGWVSTLRKISVSMDTTNRKQVEAGFLTAKTAMAAKEWGGDEFVATLAERGKEAAKDEATISKPTHTTVAAFAKAVKSIEDEQIRERVKKEVVSGKIDSPDDVVPRARRLSSAKVQREKLPPPDLKVVILRWTEEMKDFTAKLKEVKPYMEYVEESEGIAKGFRKAARALVAALEGL
jgi:hypothetical protein